ncbi:hypothetical protein [uncultured Bacteroides sp.]|uniref:hypothetical protein n=1 Tax=uncultured Bacteroides sp. TaxID=162156 RepID=UPI0025DF227C|nr:hypothetical protein [uncultured Bacteroides sp.]
MLSPQNVIRGFCKSTNPPKYKYLISLYRSEELNIIACFTTSQDRAGIPLEEIRHGVIKNKKNEIISYVFLTDVCVGKTPEDKDFHFPLQSVIRFDYCFKEGNQAELLSNFESPVIVCKLNDKEYEDLIYAMYKSDDTPEVYKPHFEKILFKLGQKKTAI